MDDASVNCLRPDYRDNPKLLDTLDRFAQLIETVADYGGTVVNRSSPGGPGPEHHLPILLLFRHALELQYGVAELVRRSLPDVAKLPARGLLEALLSSEYMLEAQTERRGRAFLVCHVHEKLKLYDRVDPTTNAGAEWFADLQQDKILGNVKTAWEVPDLPAARQNLRNMLSRPEYAAIETEYQGLAKGPKGGKGAKGPIPWYSLGGGPKNIAALAKHLKMAGLYNILYRSWSGAVHATDILDGKISPAGSGVAAIVQIANPENAQTITIVTVGMGLQLIRLVNSALGILPSEAIRQWHAAHVWPDYSELLTKEIIQVRI